MPEPTRRAQRLATELRTARGSISSSEVKEATGITPAKLSRIEACKVRAKPEDVAKLLTFYGVDRATVERLAEEARAIRQTQGWWQDYTGPMWSSALRYHLELESEALHIDSFTIDLVPGLLQHSDYTRALIEGRPDVDPEQTEARLELRERRQARVRSGELSLWAVVGETVLHQLIGGAATLRTQLRALVDAPKNVTVQVMPFRAGAHPGLGSSFHVLRFPEGWPTTVYADGIDQGLYRDESNVVRAHEATMERIKAVAMSPSESLALIQRRISELEDER